VETKKNKSLSLSLSLLLASVQNAQPPNACVHFQTFYMDSKKKLKEGILDDVGLGNLTPRRYHGTPEWGKKAKEHEAPRKRSGGALDYSLPGEAIKLIPFLLEHVPI